MCGHSNSGAMRMLFKDDAAFLDMPHLREWVRLAEPVKRIVERYYPKSEPEVKGKITEKENILVQIGNIETYPFVEKALE